MAETRHPSAMQEHCERHHPQSVIERVAYNAGWVDACDYIEEVGAEQAESALSHAEEEIAMHRRARESLRELAEKKNRRAEAAEEDARALREERDGALAREQSYREQRDRESLVGGRYKAALGFIATNEDCANSPAGTVARAALAAQNPTTPTSEESNG